MKNKQWSIKHTQCSNCGTTETKHHSKGLCKHCYDKLNYNVQYQKQYREQNKNIIFIAKEKKAQDLKEKKAKEYLKFFNKDKYYLKKYEGGIDFVCYGCSRQCRIKSPFKPKRENAVKERINIRDFNLFKELVIRECKIKPIE